MKVENWHRRHAVMLAGQLPDNPDDGLIILRLATRLLVDFLAEDDEPAKKPAHVVVPIGSNECA